MRKAAILAAAVLVCAWAATMTGCSDSTEPGDDTTATTGQLKLYLTDAPGDYDAINLEVIGVEAHRSDSNPDGVSEAGWFSLSDDTLMVDLLELADGTAVVLADTILPATHITQIRLLLGENNTIVVDGETHDLTVPSGSQSGLKLNHAFWIEAGTLYEASLDFDADRSVRVTGNGRYTLHPVIRIVVNAVSGGIEGVVDPAEARARVWTVAVDDTVVAWADTLSGDFRFGLLPAGFYDLNVEATVAGWADTVVSGVEVIPAEWTDIGAIELMTE